MGRGENTRGGISVDGSYVWLLPCVCGCEGGRRAEGKEGKEGEGRGLKGVRKKESVKVGASEWLRV